MMREGLNKKHCAHSRITEYITRDKWTGEIIYTRKYTIAYFLVQTIQLTIQYLLSTIISSCYI